MSRVCGCVNRTYRVTCCRVSDSALGSVGKFWTLVPKLRDAERVRLVQHRPHLTDTSSTSQSEGKVLPRLSASGLRRIDRTLGDRTSFLPWNYLAMPWLHHGKVIPRDSYAAIKSTLLRNSTDNR